MDSLIRKACELGEKTAHCNVEVILNATLWMEEKYRDVPNGKIAAMIALHYLMLAIRSEYRTNPQAIEEHIARALHWWKAASGDQCWNSPGWGKKDQQTRISKRMKEQMAMIQIGQKIDDFIDALEFEAYQNNQIKKVKFSNYEGKWLVLLFYPVDFASIRPTELEETAAYYDQFRKGGAEILAVSLNTAFLRKTWHENSPSIAKIARPLVADPATELCRYFRTHMEDLRLPVRGTFIIDPNGVLKAGRSQQDHRRSNSRNRIWQVGIRTNSRLLNIRRES